MRMTCNFIQECCDIVKRSTARIRGTVGSAMSPPVDLRALLSRLSPEHQGFVLGVGLLGEPGLTLDHMLGTATDCVKAIDALAIATRDERAAALAYLSQGLAGTGILSQLALATADELGRVLADEPLPLALAALAGLPSPLRGQVQTALAVLAGCPVDELPSPAALSPALLAEVQRFVFVRLGRDP